MFPHFLKKIYWDDGGIWAKGFFVSTVGINEATIRRYVQMQACRMWVKRSLYYRLRPRL
ncbi:transposase [Candidatus Giovannonibacteria bacterium]|nr:transposase [Candidatus Giovannonibacteria bacterium]